MQRGRGVGVEVSIGRKEWPGERCEEGTRDHGRSESWGEPTCSWRVISGEHLILILTKCPALPPNAPPSARPTCSWVTTRLRLSTKSAASVVVIEARSLRSAPAQKTPWEGRTKGERVGARNKKVVRHTETW